MPAGEDMAQAEKAESYRLRQAERCRERAQVAAGDRDRSLWLDLANLWLETTETPTGSQAGMVAACVLALAALSATAGSS